MYPITSNWHEESPVPTETHILLQMGSSKQFRAAMAHAVGI